MKTQRRAPTQSLRGTTAKFKSNRTQCDIVAVARRRGGGSRYWCLEHRADATAKYGWPQSVCRAAHIATDSGQAKELSLNFYRGPVALWGAVPAVYDTTRLRPDDGIHVHARKTPKDKKEIDFTYHCLRLTGSNLPAKGVEVNAVDAIYYMVSSVFGFDTRLVRCTHCGEPHLDRDWFSVHPHHRHLCAACGRTFVDSTRGIGNPIVGLRAALGLKSQRTVRAAKTLAISQADYPGGMQVWGSNAALVWTGEGAEEEGIHVHAFKSGNTDPEHPDLDDTFSEVTIDGIKLDPVMVRLLMAQNTLPHLKDRVISLICGKCGEAVFDTGERAFTPVARRACAGCGAVVKGRGRKRKTIGNPLPAILEQLAASAPRAPQTFKLSLLPETP